MRVTAQVKSATRQRILDEAAKLFRTHGFNATTTRDIAGAAGIAAGTLFNYFPTKEAVLAALADEAVQRAARKFSKRADAIDTLTEALFALIAAELRELRPFRKYIAPIFETVLSPLAAGQANETGEALRVRHLEHVAALARRHGLPDLSPVALQLYWTLYTGALAFWASDNSPRQEDTLALLDESLAMFTAWLGDAMKEPLHKNPLHKEPTDARLPD